MSDLAVEIDEMPKPQTSDAPKAVTGAEATQPKVRKNYWPLLFVLFFSYIYLPFPPAVLSVFMQGPLTENKNIIIPQGSSIKEIGDILENNGTILNPFMFRVAALVLANNKLHAGEYAFSPRESIADVVLTLREGHVVIHKFTVAEGLTTGEIVTLLKKDPVLTGEIFTPPTEGSLLPETYFYSYGDNRQTVIDRMQKGQRELLNSLWSKRETSIPLKSPEEAIIMASMIEKETGKRAEERGRVAGVFYNRLRLGMRLQSDPTVVYGMTKGLKPLNRSLTRKDLTTPSPFNTYTNDGMPPQPICNPGRAALEAALHPETHDYLYFVTNGKGGHAFAKNLKQHQKNIEGWLSARKTTAYPPIPGYNPEIPPQ